jgi:hypothetical protein
MIKSFIRFAIYASLFAAIATFMAITIASWSL